MARAEGVSWDQLSRGVKDALAWARAAEPESAEVGTRGLLIGMLRSGEDPPNALLRHFRVSEEALFDVLQRKHRMRLDPFTPERPRLDEVPMLTPSARQCIMRAAGLQREIGAPVMEVGCMWAALLDTPDATAWAAIADLITSASIDAIRDATLDWLRGNDLTYPETLQQRFPPDEREAPPPTRKGAEQPSPPYEAFDLLARAAPDLPSEEDLLGFEPLVRALYELLDDPNTGLPLAIAVTARWGAGKSSVMRQLKGLMEAIPQEDSGRQPHRRWRTVRFDAWKYERSERLWAALSKAIYDQAQEGMSLPEKLSFRLRLERRRLGWWKLLALIAAPVIVAVTAVAAAIAADLGSEGTLLATLSAVALALGTVGRYGAMIVNPFKRAIEKYARRPDYEAQLGFTAEADREIRQLVGLLAPGDRDGLAVFVDDLDRCSSKHVVEVVEAMNQIFNAAEDHRCAFILGLDRDVVATNINVAYADTVARLKSDRNPLGDDFGAQFLAKLVQLSVAIPEPEPAAIRRLMEQITGSAAPERAPAEQDVQRAQAEIQRRSADESVQSVEPAAVAVASSPIPAPAVEAAKRREKARRIKDSQEVIDAEFAALDFLESNPRQVKRFHNAFRLQLYVASEDDRVTFDFRPDQMLVLAKWVALRLRWPSMADALAREPHLLRQLERSANRESDGLPSALSDEHAAWLRNGAVKALFAEADPERRLSALRMDPFVRVA